ncbi:MAG: GTPase [Lachnospiraceae bacterium]|nr:GTPase [Lachnospiraceae bacterium]
MSQKDIPLFLITGFLESGKTQFAKESVLTDPNFVNGDSILFLVCEEGIEEYDVEELEKKNVHVEVLEQEIDVSTKILQGLYNKHKAKRVLMEYNGMWMLSTLYENMPDDWAVYQEFSFADASTFAGFNANMRALVVDKLQSADLMVFNRFTKDMDEMEFHKIVRTVNRRAQICYEYTDGKINTDEYEDPLPFDMEAPVIEIPDEYFAQWYRDVTEEPKKYIGKVIEFRGYPMSDKRFPPGTFAFGREVMTCCVEDIQYCSLIVSAEASRRVEVRTWYKARFKVEYKFHRLYGQKGPVLNLVSLEKTEVPEQPVATFY